MCWCLALSSEDDRGGDKHPFFFLKRILLQTCYLARVVSLKEVVVIVVESGCECCIFEKWFMRPLGSSFVFTAAVSSRLSDTTLLKMRPLYFCPRMLRLKPAEPGQSSPEHWTHRTTCCSSWWMFSLRTFKLYLRLLVQQSQMPELLRVNKPWNHQNGWIPCKVITEQCKKVREVRSRSISC